MTATIVDPRLDAFRRKLIKHTTIEDALTRLIRALKQPRPESVIVLTGPSGVGKSTIVRAVEKHLRIIYAQRMADDPGFLPYISVRAQAPLDGHFNWKDMLTRTLSAAGEMLIERKVISHLEIDLDGRKFDSTKGMVREELRRSLESLVRSRGVPVIVVDEASALLRLKRGAIPLLQFEILKSLAVELRIPIVLVGAYDLLGILDGTGQLLRRSQIIHCPRYQVGVESGSVDPNFIDALHALLAATGIPQETDLLENFDTFHMKSLGCVGVLKDWLDRAIETALDKSPEPFLTRSILSETALPNSEIRRLAREAKAGELKLIQDEDAELAKELGLKYTPSFDMPVSSFPLAGETGSNAQAVHHRARRTGRAGVRGPSRDTVGGVNE